LTGGPRQLALDLALAPAFGRDDFLVSPANEAALALIDRWPNWPSRVAALVGPPGSGKSHLAAIWAKASGAAVVDAATLATADVPTIAGAGAVVIEDAPGPSLDEHALFHLINLAREADLAVLIVSREDPARWPVRLPDLASRLKAATAVHIQPPDDGLLRAVLVKLFADRQVQVDESAVSYLMARMHRSLGEARDLVAEIDALALAENAAVTRPFIARALAARGQGDLFGEDQE
jgi:chromosomal replication initiation ATPase DnaA